ncbi:hypothetical protein CEUSTIGMA_g10971.t1 [Chlamydomonas eustigma]|uniref:Chitin-binding type-2 domain-containing protein n=1 Tax=Chlamydomonas eustigma TaxID=1157962 RepID=A0A250XKK4_9CHLO|nr:hypothetical protein CEUSTIGMA_g10971.t1 [Chlamydomonas eustigma]|eukprot:GAX83546.1 hypothetical protein CEUSTIGMA_g10971.t1 [Chlamydomonas eustigma]
MANSQNWKSLMFVLLVSLLALTGFAAARELAEEQKYCKYEFQGTAPSCAHSDYCDNGWTFVENGEGSCKHSEFSFIVKYYSDCKGGAYFGAACVTGNKALCEKECRKDENCKHPCTKL